ncbi:hypothetical protein WCX49_08720 [Sulfurimonas sp. HSL-1656]|uniref:hypothetical protein n=1 Tax=Thiomicrolovo subterrani TaxID=3131934 RepID=UPI0031F75872
MEQLITDTLATARTHFAAFGLDAAQVDALLEAGTRDLRKELLQLKALVAVVPPDAERVAHSLHALKGLVMNMGNNDAGRVFAVLEETFRSSGEVSGVRALLGNG